MIVKLEPRQIAMLKKYGVQRPNPDNRFYFRDFVSTGDYQEALSLMLYEYYLLYQMQAKFIPAMDNYFRKDVGPGLEFIF